jgi:hypothetical protein
MPAAATAQESASTAVHANAVQASAALNKLAKSLKDAGVPDDVVKQVDDMANATNQLASAAVGNAGDTGATPPDAVNGPGAQYQDASQGLQSDMQSAASSTPQPAFPGQ